METKKKVVGGTITAAIIGALVTVSSERAFDFVMPGDDGAAPDQAARTVALSSSTIVTYPASIELVATPNVQGWGDSQSATTLATASRADVIEALRLPVELRGLSLHYNLSGIGFGGQAGRRQAQLAVLLVGAGGARQQCPARAIEFRDQHDLTQQIAEALNAAVYASYSRETLACA